jgi:excisionase family DNA binding protein
MLSHAGTEAKGEQRELWSIGEFAAAHGISGRQVYALLSRGSLKGVRVGRRTLITNASRVEWLETLPRFQSGSPLMCGAQVAAA